MPSSSVFSAQHHDKMKRSPMSKAQPWHLRPAAATTKDGSRIPHKDKHALISSMIAPLVSSMNTEESLVCYFVGRVVIASFLAGIWFCHACCHCAIGPIYCVAAHIVCCLVSVGFAFSLVS